MANRDSIKVVCRVRPENKLELAGNYQRCVEHTDKDIKVTVSSHLYLHGHRFDQFGFEFPDFEFCRLFQTATSVIWKVLTNFHSIGFLVAIVPRLKSFRKLLFQLLMVYSRATMELYLHTARLAVERLTQWWEGQLMQTWGVSYLTVLHIFLELSSKRRLTESILYAAVI